MTNEQQKALAGLGPLMAAGLRWLVAMVALCVAILALVDIAVIDMPRFKMTAEQFAYWMAGCAAILWGTRS